MGSTAIAMLDCFFADNPSATIKETCNVLLTNCTFTYEGMKSEEREKAFQSTFILQLLANAHLHVCFGSVDVPALQLSVERNRARGAIALCVAAVRYFDDANLSTDFWPPSWSVPSSLSKQILP